jgi:hypothetical protein
MAKKFHEMKWQSIFFCLNSLCSEIWGGVTNSDLFTTTFSPYLLCFFTVNYEYWPPYTWYFDLPAYLLIRNGGFKIPWGVNLPYRGGSVCSEIWGGVTNSDLFTTTFSPYLLCFFTVNYALRLNLTILRLNKHRFFKIRLYRKGHTTDHHDITEILLKVVLNTTSLTFINPVVQIHTDQYVCTERDIPCCTERDIPWLITPRDIIFNPLDISSRT